MTAESGLYFEKVKKIFAEHGNSKIAEGQENYMRNKFSFYGIKSSDVKSLSQQIIKEQGMPQGEALKQLVRLCYQAEYRELHYFALRLTEKAIKKQPIEFIEFLEWLIVTNSWWDTVDWVARLVGIHLRRFPALKKPVTRHWMDSENIWLQRVAIIFQLNYKEATDQDLLFQCILEVRNSEEFFLKKAAGWALRQYSKTNPQAVINFIENHPDLSALTRREALKILKKEGKVKV